MFVVLSWPSGAVLTWRFVAAAMGAVAVTVAAALVPPGTIDAACLQPPIVAPVVDPFRAPPCPFCAGNRGLTYGVVVGAPVRAAATGTVTFAGRVAGTGFVVIVHADGRRATYGGIAPADLVPGQVAVAGSIVGWTESAELHFGVRVGDEYIDPAPLLGRFVRRPQLVPIDGTAPRPSPPPVLRCPGATATGAVGGAAGGAVPVAVARRMVDGPR